MIEKMTYINPEMLKWSRDISGISIELAADKFGYDKIKSWEDGNDYPTYPQLKEMASLYRKPVAIFFFPEPPSIKNISASYRTLPNQLYSSLSKEIIKLIDEARVMQLNLYELHKGINPSQLKITDIKFHDTETDLISRELRKIMGVDIITQKKITKISDAFEFWRDCFYQLGIYVFKEAFHDSSISGFCLYDKEFPVIYINNSFSFTRQIFTLFHEIFHIISETSGIDMINDNIFETYSTTLNYTIEKSCNDFAGKFLVPDDDFNSITLNMRLNDQNILKLSQVYLVSREVILRKFLDRGKISNDEYNRKSQEFNNDYNRDKMFNKNNGGNYYNTQYVYKGKRYINLAFEKYYSHKITMTQLSKYLNMKIPSIEVFASRKGWGIL